MDPLTHALSGAALARAFPAKALPRSQLIWLVLLAIAPDADFVLKFISDATYLQYHRGITHSLLMLPLWAWLIHALLPGQRAAAPLTPLLISLALGMHILLDLITSFGTMVLAPVSDWRASLDLVFIIDPLFTACLALPLLLMLVWKQHARTFAACGLLLMFAYLGMSAYLHHRALDIVKMKHPGAQAYAALPMPFSPFHWQLIATYPDDYMRTSINLYPGFSGTANIFPRHLSQPYMRHMHAADQLVWQRLTRMDSLNMDKHLPGITFYRWFARYPVLLEMDSAHYEFGDLRFAAGMSGITSSFRLRIQRTPPVRAWLVWRSQTRTELK